MVGVESLSSYILKTCLFCMVENTPESFWTPDNLFTCLQSCLRYLLQWIVNGRCPNYFIPDENMLERLERESIAKVQRALETLISANCKYLPCIRSDGFGPRLEVMVSSQGHSLKQLKGSILNRNRVRDTVTLHLQVNFSKNELFQKVWNGKKTVDCVKALFDLVSDLKGIGVVADHTKEQTAKALSFILPHIEISLMSNIIASECYNSGETLNYLTSGNWEGVALNTDMFSAKLKQATFLHVLGHHQASFCSN